MKIGPLYWYSSRHCYAPELWDYNGWTVGFRTRWVAVEFWIGRRCRP